MSNMYADNEDTDDMKLKIKVFNGKFQNVTQSLKLSFDNDEFAACIIVDVCLQLNCSEIERVSWIRRNGLCCSVHY